MGLSQQKYVKDVRLILKRKIHTGKQSPLVHNHSIWCSDRGRVSSNLGGVQYPLHPGLEKIPISQGLVTLLHICGGGAGSEIITAIKDIAVNFATIKDIAASRSKLLLTLFYGKNKVFLKTYLQTA